MTDTHTATDTRLIAFDIFDAAEPHDVVYEILTEVLLASDLSEITRSSFLIEPDVDQGCIFITLMRVVPVHLLDGDETTFNPASDIHTLLRLVDFVHTRDAARLITGRADLANAIILNTTRRLIARIEAIGEEAA